MSLDVGLDLRRDKAARQGSWSESPLRAIVAVFVAAILLRQFLPYNVDVSWWLIVSERMLDGQRLYVDILETNPPMAGLVYFLGVALARVVHVRAELAIDGLIFALIASSLALTWHIVQSSSLRERAGGAVAVWTTVLLTVLPMSNFGQREHLALVALLPALAVYVLRANRESVAPSAFLIAGLSAAITMNFKPYFVFAVGLCVLTAAARARCWRVLFAAENWIAAALVVVHGIGTFVFYPEYFTLIYPLVRDVYLLLKAPLIAMLLTSATALWLVTMMLALALQGRRRKADNASLIIIAGSLGFAISFFVQGKGWDYHAYPMVALGLLAAGWAISTIDDERTAARPLRIGAIAVVTLVFASACMWFKASVDTRQIEDQVARLGPRPKILMLSAAAVIGHPMVRDLQGTWVSRQEALWVREVVRRARMDGAIDAQAAARLEGYVARERAGLIEDFRRQPPDVVLIDNRNSDWGTWAHGDPDLSGLLQPYILVQTIDGIEILRRLDRARP